MRKTLRYVLWMVLAGTAAALLYAVEGLAYLSERFEE